MIRLLTLLSLLLSCSTIEQKILGQKEQVEYSYLEESPSLKDEQIFCDKDNSCLSGKCLSRGDGLNVCFREGKNGEFCRANKDCLNQKCADRGDGIHVCMGNGIEGDFCHKSEDCSKGSCEKPAGVFNICLLR